MNVDEKAQRLMLVTDIKFRLDNKTGEIVESEQPIDQAVIDEAMSMPQEEFESRNKRRQIQEEVKLLSKTKEMRLAYFAYRLDKDAPKTFQQFVQLAVQSPVFDDLFEDKQV